MYINFQYSIMSPFWLGFQMFRTYRCRGALWHLQRCLQIPRRATWRHLLRSQITSICFTFYTPVTDLTLTCISQEWKISWKWYILNKKLHRFHCIESSYGVVKISHVSLFTYPKLIKLSFISDCSWELVGNTKVHGKYKKPDHTKTPRSIVFQIPQNTV